MDALSPGQDGPMELPLARPSGWLAVALAAAVLATPGQARAWETVVVTGSPSGSAGVTRAVEAVEQAGGQVLRRIPLVHGVVARLPHGTQLRGLRATPDSALRLSSLTSGGDTAGTVQGTVGAPAGLDGSGVTVAVVDTGVADVPGLAGRVTHVDVTGDGVGDGYGHGTFVAGLVAGETTGVAPGASVLDVKVGHDDGSTSLSDVLAGLQVVAEHPEVRVVNLSLSSGSRLPTSVDPLCQALDALWDSGVTVVVPAGNDGPLRNTVSSPGNDPTLLTVGALDEAGTTDRSDDRVTDWSSRGGLLLKPDLVAPGAHLTSLGVPGSVIWNANPTAQRAGGRFVGSGTSFSTAVTTGATAVLLQARPRLTPDRVKTVLRRSAYDVAGLRSATGAGGLDLGAALVTRSPYSLYDGWWGWGSFGDGGWDANSWSANSWSANSWSARQWSARQWSARQWSTLAWE